MDVADGLLEQLEGSEAAGLRRTGGLRLPAGGGDAQVLRNGGFAVVGIDPERIELEPCAQRSA